MVFSELIALYLFLGGTAAGSFAVLSAVELRDTFLHAADARRSHMPSKYAGRRSRSAAKRRIAKAVYSASFAMVVVGMLCLLADLGRPEAFYLLFLCPTSSFVSIGTFALTGFAACAAVALAESVLTLGPVWERIALAAKAVGMLFALVVMAYTGLLLETVVAVHLWQSFWLPILFLLSALSCGCAVVLLGVCLSEGCEGARTWLRVLSVSDAALIALELIVTAAYALTVNATYAERPFDALLFGDQSLLFWLGFAGCGMIAPLCAELVSLRSRRFPSGSIVAMMATLILVGGFALRFALVSAGIQIAV